MACKRGVLITEDDRKHILSLYSLINEAESQKVIDIASQSFFGNGKWKELSSDGRKDFENKMNNQVVPFLSQNKGSVVSVKITAGESQVPNKDLEVSPPKDVPVGELAKRRAQTMKSILEEYFAQYLKLGYLSTKPEFQEPSIEIGKTVYKPGYDINKPKYQEERFVNIKLSLKSAAECVVGLTIEVLYNNQKDPKFPCRGDHQCNNAQFDVKLNGVSIGAANLNNANDGGSRSFIKEIDDSLAKQIIANTNNNQLIISTKCLSQNCHSTTPEVKISKGGNVLYWGCASSLNVRGDTSEKTILVLDACGNPIRIGNRENIKVGDNPNIKLFSLNNPKESDTKVLDSYDKQGKLVKKLQNGTYQVIQNFNIGGDTAKQFKVGDILKPAS